MDVTDRVIMASIKTLAEMVPVAGALTSNMIEALYEEAENRRVRLLFEKLEKGRTQLTPELIQSEDFLYCFMATVRTVKRTRRTEKIEYFANLILNGTNPKNSGVVDKFEAMLELLEQLTYDEIEGIRFLADSVPEGTPYQKSLLRFLDDSGRTRADIFHLLGRLLSKGLLNISGTGGGLNAAAGIEWTINPTMYRFLDSFREYRFANV